MLEVVDGLTFPVADEKQEWVNEAYKWRLPYWDWGLVERHGIPAIFTTPRINLRQPKKADGSIPVPLDSVNPLSRYQVLKAGQLVPMGKLPAPYTVSDDLYGSGPLPVRVSHIFQRG